VVKGLPFCVLVLITRFELITSWMATRRSAKLSYTSTRNRLDLATRQA
jgi:hypothetical protein